MDQAAQQTMIHIAGRISCEEIRTRAPEAMGASIVMELAPATNYELVRPVFLDTDYASDRARNLLQQYISTQQVEVRGISLIEASNAILVGQGAVVTRQRLLITDTVTEYLNFGTPPDGCVYTDTGLSIALRLDKYLSGTCLLVKRPWYNNYGHWLVDLLPILQFASGASLSIDHIIFGDTYVPSLKSTMKAAAERLFPGTPYSFLGDTEPVRVERLYYVSPVHVPPIGKHPAAVAHLHDYGVGQTGCKSCIERIFISRKSGSRRILNEIEVNKVLSDYGFQTIYPEDLTFSEQVSIFHNAKIVVGTKGAAITNVIFCRSGVSLLILSPSDFPDPFFWDLVSTRGINYGEIFCRTCGDDQHSAHVDFVVDTDKLVQALAAVVSHET